LEEQVSFEYWSAVDDTHSCIRFVTAWHTTKEEVEALLTLLRG
jgi:threonine aldolase